VRSDVGPIATHTDRPLPTFPARTNAYQMRTNRTLHTCLALALLFTILFNGVGLGLNLLLFEVVVFGALAAMHRLPLKRDVLITVGGSLLTAVLVVLYGSSLAIFMNIVSVVLAMGVVLAPELGALHQALVLGLSHLVAAPRALWRSLPATGSPVLGITPRGAVSGALVPLVVLLFVGLYSGSNPKFEELMDKIYAWIGEPSASLPFVFLLGLGLSCFLLLITRNERLIRWATSKRDALRPGTEQDPALRAEVRTGIVLLVTLNALLLLLNVLDIHHVWFNFTFTGQYLKQFVHEGTWLLMVSIVLGALIVLYYFRGDVNFHSRNRSIKALSYIWLAQNAVLAISVAVRDYWYVHYFALAYKRIGVVFFLLAALVGLALILQKVRHKRSHHFLARWNMLSVYLILLVMSLFDWDTLVARYNVAQREKAFVELNFLADLEDKALPHLILSDLQLENLEDHNRYLIGADRYRSWLYMHRQAYARRIHWRTVRFVKEYEERSWREWNLADARAYAALRTVEE
jgi:Domain of unknown function (DUF4173)